jgi:hypothetical protein
LLIAGPAAALVLVGIATSLQVQSTNLHHTGQQTKALFLAQQMLEVIKNDALATVARYHGVDTRNLGTCPSDDLESEPKFRGGTNCRNWAHDLQLSLAQGRGPAAGYGTIAVDPLAPNLLRVRVTVFWLQAIRGRSSVMLETLITG